MTQQVVHTRVRFTSTDTLSQSYSWGATFEALGTGTSVSFSQIATTIGKVLNTVNTGQSVQMSHYIGQSVVRGSTAVTLESYDVTAHLDGSPAGSPVDVRQIALTGAVGVYTPTPEGVSAVWRWAAPYGSDTEFGPGDRPRARDRGRLYFGPLDGGAFYFNSSVGEVQLTNTCVTDMGVALATLLAAGTDANITTMVQWSRKNAAVKQISNNYGVDGRPKYQRRRAKA